ncbi:MAG: hypothetical protein ACM3OH_09975 [Bacillota bacterium]|jgi:hypothetical protein
MIPRSCLVVLAGVVACSSSRKSSSTACGIAALAGPSQLISEFGVRNQTLGSPPATLPEELVARLAAGPAYRAVTGRQPGDSLWVIGVDGTLPPKVKLGYGVLVLDQQEKPRGIMLYEGLPVERAPHLGTVTMGPATVPLIGVQTDPKRFEDPACPFFPDSVLAR